MPISARRSSFVAVGLLLSEVLDVIEADVSHEAVKVLAEVTLVWVLFADAARVRLRDLRADLGLYTRLLAVGLPLTIAAGTLLATGCSTAWASGWRCSSVLRWHRPTRRSAPR